MTRHNIDPTTPGLRAGSPQADGMALLIQVPRVAEERERGRVWRPRAAASGRPSRRGSLRPDPADFHRSEPRPRRRLRRGVRRAGWCLLVAASMAATFTMGWTTRGSGLPRRAVLGVVAAGRDPGGPPPSPKGGIRPSDDPSAGVEADAIAIAPALGAPIADADVPVVFPGYVLPDDTREEPAHAGG